MKEKELWQNPEHAKKCLYRRIPSGPEQMFMNLCNEYGLQYQYVGNGALIIDRKNPDFVGIYDEHKLIEIWGGYFKKGRDPQDKVNLFKIRGYQCLVIWASELVYPEKVILRIKKFETENA